MSDDAKVQNMEDESPDFHNTSKVAFSQNMDLLQKDLSLLYLKGNASARNKFGDIYPEIAQYLFGEDLIRYDYEGCDDIEHRDQLEEEALQRRFDILNIMEDLREKSVKAGSLEMEYVSKVIDHFGVEVSRYMYAENIIERVRPGALKTVETKKKESDDGKKHYHTQETLDDDTILRAAEQEILASKPKDTAVPLPTMEAEGESKPSNPVPVNIEDELANIKPIDMRDANDGMQSPDTDSEGQTQSEFPPAEEIPAASPVEEMPASEVVAPQAPPVPPEPERAEDNRKSSLGPPLLRDEEKKEAPPIFAHKPDFMNIKVADEPKPEEKPQISYKEIFNTLAAKVA
ncbi:MAG: hypothetical protein OEY94_00715 [Alphaproteobacteria bacterium]|nr:hypothetical protein [Alphaproteobacteria bacterium]